MSVYEGHGVTLHHGDCLDVLRSLPDCSVDSVVCDPPYGLEFMGKDWDGADGFRRSLNPNDAGRDNAFGRTSRTSPEYRTTSKATAGMAGTGYTDGAERLERPSHFGGLNPRCRTCDRWQRGGNPCRCEAPDFPNERLPRLHTFQRWCEAWATECLRVLKPGGHLLAFGGTRTWHRLACAVEDAGFEVRDSIAWLYGSGFPKSLDVSKAIDKAAGAEREVVGPHPYQALASSSRGASQGATHGGESGGYNFSDVRNITAPATPDAERWQGWGTALKPAFEPIVVARKPLAGTVAANVLAWGTGALNIDGCRVEGEPWKAHSATGLGKVKFFTEGETPVIDKEPHTAGRWPANVVLDETQAEALDEQSGDTTRYFQAPRQGDGKSIDGSVFGQHAGDGIGYNDTGGASRYFYVAKADASERPRVNGTAHPTVKPLDLMRWLVRLVTPPGGTVLEPFAGSGTTVEACIVEGFQCIAIEREADYLPLIRQRIDRRRDPVEALRGQAADLGLFDLLGGEGA